MNNLFNWDGTDVTYLIKDSQIREAEYGKNNYWVIKNNDITQICLVRNSTNILPCIIDEMKPIFGLEKIGTHWCKYKSKIVILLKIVLENGCVIEELTLNKISFKHQLKEEVQKIFIFREILGMSKNFESSILLRKKGCYIKPVCFYDPNMNPNNSGTVLPNTVLEKWFPDEDIDSLVLKMFNIKTIDDISCELFKLRNKIDELVKRINLDAVMYIDEIISRIRSRLQFILS